jgi:hypothetical protein
MEAILTDLDPDIRKVLERTGIDPRKATDEQITLADRMIQIYTMADGRPRIDAASNALWRRLYGGQA